MSARRLLVDMGNSRVKWAEAVGGELRAGDAFATVGALAQRLDGAFGPLAPPAAVHVSNVAGPAAAAELAGWVARRWGCPLVFAESATAAGGIVNGYENPSQLGVDRWLALRALPGSHGLPACVADCGTALTIDLVDAEGRHRGGAIAPGPALMGRALIAGTHGVANATDPDSDFPGRTTAAGVHAGAWLACAGLLEKSLGRSAALLGAVPPLIVTGGAGEALGAWLAVPYRYDPHLVLRGLLTLAESQE